MKIFGYGLFGLGLVIGFVFGLWTLVLDARILFALGGVPFVVIGFIVFPIVVSAPFYAGFVSGDWHPLQVSAVAIVIPSILMGVGSMLTKRDSADAVG
jgi:hypothetical protein